MSDKKSLGADEIVMARKMSRRSMALLGGAATGALAALGIVSTTACCFGGTGAGSTGGVATGCSDSDPTDGAGRGTHCSGTTVPPAVPGAPVPTPGARTCSDSDPTDPAGAGTHC